jgi:hypothetical protein
MGLRSGLLQGHLIGSMLRFPENQSFTNFDLWHGPHHEGMCGSMLIHEEVQLVLKDLSVPGPVHYSSRLEELPLQLKQPQTTLGGCLTLFLVNLGSNRSVPLALLWQKIWFLNLSSKWLS